MALVAVTRRLPEAATARLAEQHEVRQHDGVLPPSDGELGVLLADADGAITLLTDHITDRLLDAAPRLRVIANYAVGHDNLDLPACRRRGILVGNVPGVLTAATADLTMALLLGVARRVPEGQWHVATGAWRTWEPLGHLGLELTGAHLLVVGAGRIGRAVADRAAAFGMVVTVIGRTTRSELHDALARADVVSLHCPLDDDTRYLIDAVAIAAMRPGGILINTARGALVDHDALAVALDRGHLAGVGLDVTDPEPLFPEHRLLQNRRAVVTPHIASATHVTRSRMADMAVDNIVAGLAGRPLPHPVP